MAVVAIKYVPRHSGAELIKKVVKLKTGKLPLPASKQVVSGVRIISTAWKPVEDAKTALKEANANRLARAKFEQALSSDDPGVVSAMLNNLEDDGTAGAVLLMTALPLLLERKQHKPLHSENEKKAHNRDVRAKKYYKIADELGLNPQDDPYPAAETVRAKLQERGEKAPSARTIARAFGAK